MRILAFFLFFCSVSFSQTTYLMDFNDYPLGSHEAQPSLNLRWSKQLNNFSNSFYVSSVTGSLQGKAFTGLGTFQALRTYRWNYKSYSAGIPSSPIKASANAQIKTRFRIEGGSYNVFSVVFHNTSNGSVNNYISADVVSYGATKQLRLTVVVNNAPTYRSGQSVTVNNNTWYWFKAKREGNLFQVKFWQEGTSEPQNWMESWTENTFTGVEAIPELGVYSDVSMTVDYWEYTDLTVTRLIDLTSNFTGITAKTGTVLNITWTQTGLDTVGIYLSSDAGKSYKWILHSLSSTDGSYSLQWTIPTGIISEECRIKLKSLNMSDSSSLFTIMPDKYLKITTQFVPTVNGAVPDNIPIKFESIAVDSVNLFYSTDSLSWIPVKENLHVTRNSFVDTTTFNWSPDRRIYGNMYIKVAENVDTTTIFPVKTGLDLIDIGMSAPASGGFQNVVWYSNPIIVDGKLISLSVKTFHWGFYGQSYIYLYTYNKVSRQWQQTSNKFWDFDSYLKNGFYADSDNINLFYFGGESLTDPNYYFYIQIALNGSDFSYHNYERAINTAPLTATDLKTYPISDGKRQTHTTYLGREYYLTGNKIFYSDSIGHTDSPMPLDTLLFADLSGTKAENLSNPGLYAFDNRIMLTEYYSTQGTFALNFAFRALPKKAGLYVSDILKLGENFIARRDFFRGIYPKAKR